MNEEEMGLFLNEPMKLGYLLHFCEKQFCSENVQFYMEVKMFRDWVRTDTDSFKNDGQRFVWTQKSWKQIDETVGIGNSASSRQKLDHTKVDLDSSLSRNIGSTSWPSKIITREAIEDNVKKLWNKFLCDEAMLQICIPAKTMSLTIQRLEHLDAYCCHIYDEALIDPVKTIRRDIMPRFLVSDVNERMNKALVKIKDRPPASALVVPPPNTCQRLSHLAEEYLKLAKAGNQQVSTTDFLRSKLAPMDFIIDEKLYKSLLNFLRSIEKKSLEDISNEALEIYNYFVAQGSAFEVSISSRRRQQVMTSLANPKIDAFSSMDKQALNVVETQLPNFFKSKDFTNLVQVYITSQQDVKKYSCLGFL